MPGIRYATIHDAATITQHRHRMFSDNAYTTETALGQADLQFEPWVRTHIEDGRYIGLMLEKNDRIVAAAGIFFAEFPPHWMDPQPLRAYVLNVYTTPASRGKGYARLLMDRVLKECRKRSVPTVVLHASRQGRPVYEKMGFKPTDEMMLRLDIL